MNCVAEYTATSVNTKIININAGSPFGYVPVILTTVLDDWGVNVVAGDTIKYSSVIALQIIRSADNYPVVISPGGGQAAFNSGNFASYTYPIESTPTADGTKLEVSKNMSSSAGALIISLKFKGNTNTQVGCYSNRSNSRVRPLVLWCDSKGRTLLTGNVSLETSPDSEYTIAGTNSYLAADNNGLPYNITAGLKIKYDTEDKRFVVNYFLNLSEIDYKELALDPYAPGGTTGTGGGTGNFDGTGDNISIPSLPTLSAVNAGFITLFNPTLAQMNSLSSYMWSGLFDLNGWRKIFADPMDAILGLSIVPVAVPNGGAKEVKVGNISTGVSMTIAASQYVTVDCGTLNVQEYWGAYLDYDPYTKAEIYLPYIGTHPVAVDDIMGKPVHVVYHVDILSGACCAYVQCGGSVLYTFAGQCSSSIPITGDNWTRVVNGALSIAGAIGGMVASGGMTAPMALSAAGSVASNAVNSSKPAVEKSGSMGGTGGMLGVQTPYLILTRPRQAIPEKLNEFTGYPSYITTVLADCEGYTEVESVHLDNVPATSSELDEIETLLKGGVIF